MHNFTLEQFRATHAAGGVLSVTLRANGAGFEMQIETRKGLASLVKARNKSEIRRFLDPRKALLLLRELGILEAHIDSQQWRPEDNVLQRTRPDRSEAMKAAHEALSHSDWLREKLARSASSDQPKLSHEQVMDEAQAIIDRKRKTYAGDSSA